jgi:tetratricopeptide (TPR) repeat protein
LILLIAAALASAAAPPARHCPELVTAEAMICRAIEAQADGKPEVAAQSFEEAVNASSDKDPATARMLAAAGNMWLVARQPGKAALDLDKALAIPGGLQAEQHGEALLDRARAAEAQNDLKTARAKLSEAAASISDDPFYWYFSAALAVRENDAATAQSAINKALAMAPADASILFEAGHVAHFTGDEVGARNYWQRAAERDPGGPIGKAARDALVLLPVPLTVKTEPQPPK